MSDIVFPDKNEEKFISLAEKLGTKELILVYPYSKHMLQLKNKVIDFQQKTKIKLKFGIIAKQKDIQKAKKFSGFVINQSTDKDQHTLEKLKPNLIFDLEQNPAKDRQHYRLSGLNQVLCEIAHKNNITIGFSLTSILNSKNKPKLLGRIKQNLKLCKKYKVKTLFASFTKNPLEMKSEKDLKSFERILRQ
jgi:RNase P/RNase MRP subunit p30